MLGVRSQDGSAIKNGEVEQGDYLFSVNGKEVDGMPYEEQIQEIIDAEGPSVAL